MTASRRALTSWSWRDASNPGLKGETRIPTCIHLDLLNAKLIPDPLIGKNEADVQWAHSKTWVYTTTFEVAPAGQDERIDLVFEGLDTFAQVKLNGDIILTNDNMFISSRVDVRRLIQANNELEITFDPAYEKGEAFRREKGHLLCWNGHYGRVYVRKAQYHFGWDWGPSLVTCGPWKPIYLERYISRIEEVRVDVELTDSLDEAAIVVNAIVNPWPSEAEVDIELIDPAGTTVETSHVKPDVETRFNLTSPELWYPHTHGAQPLYKIRISIRSDHRILDSQTQTFGVRRIELIQSSLKEGSTFYFKCNGIPIFMGGSNWIPSDMFLTRMTPGRYSRWINLVVKGNQNMIRVWGGGIYEDDAFYDECDAKGILVWQDFCFACGQYPSSDDFISSVKKEAEQAIKRLRHHASLAIWAGNNEDYQIANEGLHHDMSMPEKEWSKSSFGARLTYERILPDLIEEQTLGSIYWPGSPFGGVDNNSDRTVGDVHIWNVSSGMLLPYQRYPDVAGRFVSEFGMMSCPSMATVKESFFNSGSKDCHPQSSEFEFHCKASSYEKRMFTCMGENVRLRFDLNNYVYLSQLVQSEAMHYAYSGWRRKFEGRECGGALVWQMNDAWPATSWAIVDHFERPKMAYYAMARDLRPLTIGISRKMLVNPRPNLQHEAFCNGRTKADAASVIPHATPHIYPPKESTFEVWVSNSTVCVKSIKAQVRFISVASGREVREPILQVVNAKEMGTTEVVRGAGPEEEPTVIVSEIFDATDTLIAYDVDWPQPLKHLTFEDRGLQVKVRGEELLVTTVKPVKGLSFTNDDVDWSDNGIDVVPGQNLTVVARGLKEAPKWWHYEIQC